MAIKFGDKNMEHVVYNGTALDKIYYKTTPTDTNPSLYWARPFLKTYIDGMLKWRDPNNNVIGTITPNAYQKEYTNGRNADCYYYGDTIELTYNLTTPGWFIDVDPAERFYEDGRMDISLGVSKDYAEKLSVVNRLPDKKSTVTTYVPLHVSPVNLNSSTGKFTWNDLGSHTQERLEFTYDFKSSDPRVTWNAHIIVVPYSIRIKNHTQVLSKKRIEWDYDYATTPIKDSDIMTQDDAGGIAEYLYDARILYQAPSYQWDPLGATVPDECLITAPDVYTPIVKRPYEYLNLDWDSTSISTINLQVTRGPLSQALGLTTDISEYGLTSYPFPYSINPEDKIKITINPKKGYIRKVIDQYAMRCQPHINLALTKMIPSVWVVKLDHHEAHPIMKWYREKDGNPYLADCWWTDPSGGTTVLPINYQFEGYAPQTARIDVVMSSSYETVITATPDSISWVKRKVVSIQAPSKSVTSRSLKPGGYELTITFKNPNNFPMDITMDSYSITSQDNGEAADDILVNVSFGYDPGESFTISNNGSRSYSLMWQGEGANAYINFYATYTWTCNGKTEKGFIRW